MPLTCTGDVGLPPAPDPEPERPEPTEESSLDSDLGIERADPELIEPEPESILVMSEMKSSTLVVAFV